MDNKSHRLNEIRKIIQSEDVCSQEDLLERLVKIGFSITQATLSRDLKQLRISKMPNNQGTYVYVFSDRLPNVNQNIISKHKLEGLLTIEFSGSIGVIKTVPAFSHTIASSIDSAEIQSIAGTVAGNDTIIFVIREAFSVSDVIQQLSVQFPDIKEKLQ
jgi:transcriptional regulator of arginine metabolism